MVQEGSSVVYKYKGLKRGGHPHQLEGNATLELHVRDVLRRVQVAAQDAGTPRAARREPVLLSDASDLDAGPEAVLAVDAGHPSFVL